VRKPPSGDDFGFVGWSQLDLLKGIPLVIQDGRIHKEKHNKRSGRLRRADKEEGSTPNIIKMLLTV